jgi:diadenosine tetraphosphate (Ap4A) HIT family hydrolase
MVSFFMGKVSANLDNWLGFRSEGNMVVQVEPGLHVFTRWVYHSHFHVIPSFGGKAPGTPAPRRKLSEAEYNETAAKLRAAWPK